VLAINKWVASEAYTTLLTWAFPPSPITIAVCAPLAAHETRGVATCTLVRPGPTGTIATMSAAGTTVSAGGQRAERSREGPDVQCGQSHERQGRRIQEQVALDCCLEGRDLIPSWKRLYAKIRNIHDVRKARSNHVRYLTDRALKRPKRLRSRSCPLLVIAILPSKDRNDRRHHGWEWRDKRDEGCCTTPRPPPPPLAPLVEKGSATSDTQSKPRSRLHGASRNWKAVVSGIIKEEDTIFQ